MGLWVQGQRPMFKFFLAISVIHLQLSISLVD
jgi:hypothetical protein